MSRTQKINEVKYFRIFYDLNLVWRKKNKNKKLAQFGES